MHTPNEFDFLTQETVQLSEHLSDTDFEREFFLEVNAFDENHSIILNDQENTIEEFENTQEALIEEQDSILDEYPQGPGLIYAIHKSGTTFTIRGYVATSIEEAFDNLTMGDAHSYRALRLEEEQLDLVEFMEFDSTAQAEIVQDQIFNKRFPLEEDILCNISDPGFSWWYGKTDDGFRINFKSHKLVGAGERLRLGPIGDVVVAHHRLAQLEGHFKSHMPVSEMVISEKQFILKSSDTTHPILNELMRVFEKGEIDEESALLCELCPSLRLYVKELAAVRRFWLKIELSLLKNQEFYN